MSALAALNFADVFPAGHLLMCSLCLVAGFKTSPRPSKMGLFDKIAEKLDSKTPHDHGGTSEAHLQPGCLCEC